MVNTRVQLVWFKRDLRIADHAPLNQAAEQGPVLPLYVIEPGLWEQPDAAGRHWAFIAESLLELREALAALGQPLVVRVGEITQVLETLQRSVGIDAIWSHQETGNDWTYRRDERVRHFLKIRGITWQELPQYGVVRRLASRDGWSGQWEIRMAAPQALPPQQLMPLEGIEPGLIPNAEDLGIKPDPCAQRQPGGRNNGLERLESFLTRRGEAYHAEMSSPVTAYESCSRLSPHLAYGTLSIREVVQTNRNRRRQVKAQPAAARGTWAKALAAFEGRLHWHCHFIQKLESEPRIEFENLHRACDNLREGEFDTDKFDAWCRAETGFPFVDACMRALEASGWINFRMRAMLMSFASYHLWLHWRQPALFLARRFSDYEPGIHYAQTQMQAGTTGINTFRIYNPVKQSQDQDPAGRFIRHWLPQLAQVPDRWIHTPWEMDRHTQGASECVIGRDYPSPVVDHLAAARTARQRMASLRRGVARAEGQKILQRHGSRKGGSRPRP
ncbi:MAG: deoxyribodipyrimidine photo-lyase [Thiogranum sp.]